MAQQKNKALPIGEFGKVPPQAVDLEEAILGAIILEKEAIERIDNILKPEIFYNQAHALIFEVISDMHQNRLPIDLNTIVQHFKKMGKSIDEIGGPFFLTQLVNKVASSAHIERHAYIIHQQYIKREIIRIESVATANAFDDTLDVEDILSELNTSVDKLNDLATGFVNDNSLKSIIYKCLTSLEERTKNTSTGTFNGIPTGLAKLDTKIVGWQPGNLIILAGRPGMGKTAVMIHFAKFAAMNKFPTVVYSLEMCDQELTDRILVGESSINPERYKTGRLDEIEWKSLESTMKDVEHLPIYIDQTPAATTRYIRSTARRLHKKGKCKLICIDYLGLMEGQGENENVKLSRITRELKMIAKELMVPIILLCQLSREVEKRPNKRPQLSDLRDSGSIEQDADIVMFVYRPSYYGLTGPGGEDLTGQGKLIISKFRNGSLSDTIFFHNESLTKISDEEITEPKPF
jgi:replicative DNA helicase